jgi:hypothetical protein
MEITTTYAACIAQPRRLAMPSAAFGGARVWLVATRNAKHVPGVPVWSPPHC